MKKKNNIRSSLEKEKEKNHLFEEKRSRREVEVGREKSFGRKIFYHINFLKLVIPINIYLEVTIK